MFKATLGYRRFNQSKRETKLTPLIPALGVQAFNPSTREVETGSDMAGWREIQGGRRQELTLLPEDFIDVRTLVAGCSASLISQLSPPDIWLQVFIIKTN